MLYSKMPSNGESETYSSESEDNILYAEDKKPPKKRNVKLDRETEANLKRIKKLENQILNLKEDVIVSLKDTINQLDKNLKERSEWLRSTPGTVNKRPKFSNRYTAKSLLVNSNIDTKVADKLDKKGRDIKIARLSNSEIKLISRIKEQARKEIVDYAAKTEDSFKIYTGNVQYDKAGKTDLEKLNDDLYNCISRERDRIMNKADREINRIIMNSTHKRKRKCPKKNKQDDKNLNIIKYNCPELKEFKKANALKYREYSESIDLRVNKQAALFEDRLEEYSKQDHINIDSMRKENMKSLQIHADIDKKQFSQALNRDYNIKLSEILEKKYSKDQAKINILYNVYAGMMNKIKNINSFTKIYALEYALSEVDSLYEKIQEGIYEMQLKNELLDFDAIWEFYADRVCDYYVSVAAGKFKIQFDSVMKMYAILYFVQNIKNNQSEMNEDDLRKIEEDKEELARIEKEEKINNEISELRELRDNLLEQIRALDEAIRNKIVKPPKPPKEKKKRSKVYNEGRMLAVLLNDNREQIKIEMANAKRPKHRSKKVAYIGVIASYAGSPD